MCASANGVYISELTENIGKYTERKRRAAPTDIFLIESATNARRDDRDSRWDRASDFWGGNYLCIHCSLSRTHTSNGCVRNNSSACILINISRARSDRRLYTALLHTHQWHTSTWTVRKLLAGLPFDNGRRQCAIIACFPYDTPIVTNCKALETNLTRDKNCSLFT